MNSKNDSKLTVINDHTLNKNQSKLGKQLKQEQKQNHRDGDHMEDYQQGVGWGRVEEKVQGIRSINGRHKIDRGRLRIV